MKLEKKKIRNKFEKNRIVENGIILNILSFFCFNNFNFNLVTLFEPSSNLGKSIIRCI